MIGRRICASLAAVGVVLAGLGMATEQAQAEVKFWTPDQTKNSHSRSVLIWTVPAVGEAAVPRGFDEEAPDDQASKSSEDAGATEIPPPTRYKKSKQGKTYTVTTITPSRHYRYVKRALGQRFLGFKRQYRGQRYLGFRKSRRLNKYFVQKSTVHLDLQDNNVVIVNEHPGPVWRRNSVVNTIPAYVDLPDID